MSCGKGKRTYPSQRAAITVALRRSLEAGPLRTYYCKPCRGWHLTSKVQLAKEK